MNLRANLSGKLSLLMHTFYFLKKHLLIIFALGLVAAFGRVIQLGGFGQVTRQGNIFLEIVIELARILLFLYVLGLASFKTGALRIKQLFTNTTSRKLYWSIVLQKIKTQWIEIVLNFLVFSGIAWVINYLIDLLAYQTCFYLTLKKNEILNHASSEWTIILFFKNISVIPFTLTFEALFLLWIINKFRVHKTPTIVLCAQT